MQFTSDSSGSSDTTGLLEFKGTTDASANPNYPAASKGDFYLVSVAGKIGGASGTVVEVGDSYYAIADNAGGTQASVGTSWAVIQGNTALGTMATQNANAVNISGGTVAGITDITVADGGTGRSTSTTAYGLIAAGTTATGAHQTLAAGATTEILVGGGASALPVWTTANGSGAPVRTTSPALVTPALGTPTSGTLTSCTGYTVGNISGLGTGVATALAVNVGSAGAFVTFNGALGTPSSGTLTNCTSIPAAQLTGDVAVARIATALTAPGAIGGGTPSTGAFTTLTASTSISISGVAVPTISSTNTLTNKRVTPRVATAADAGGTWTPSADNDDQNHLTACSQATAIAAPTGTPVSGQPLILRIKDNGTGRALTWDGIYRAIGVTLPTTTVANKTHYVGFRYNFADTKWDALGVAAEA